MPDERPEVPGGHLSSSEGPPEPRGQRGAARAWWHTTSQRRGNFGATRTTPTPSAPSTSASSSTSSAAGRPLTSHTSAFSRFSAGRRALSRFSKQQGPGSLRSFPGGRRHPMGWRRLLPARWGDGPHVLAQSVSKQGQSFQVAHCAERCDQRGLQARAPGRQTLLIVSQNQITVPDLPWWPIDHGQVVTPPEQQRRAGWSGTKRSQGVGGKLEVDAPDAQRRKCRTVDAMEPVFFYRPSP